MGWYNPLYGLHNNGVINTDPWKNWIYYYVSHEKPPPTFQSIHQPANLLTRKGGFNVGCLGTQPFSK